MAAVQLHPAIAQELRIGLGGPVTTLDPHFYNTSPNNLAAFQVFDRLVHRSAQGRLVPGLALSWRPISDTVWEFVLRPGVKWQDGQDFTAKDVAFALDRAGHVPNNLGGFESLVRPIAAIEIVDPLTVRITTRTPDPGLANDLASIAIVSEHVGRNATTADYNSGRAEMGTGPYKFVSYTPGDRVVLARNDAWWGPRQDWSTVTLSMVGNIGARTAGLLAGDLDIIEAPAATDLPKLRTNPQISLFSIAGGRVAYINPIFAPSPQAPPITDKTGKPYAATPLRLLKVRQALSLAINRTAIVDRILLGTGVATGQWMPPGSYSYAPGIEVRVYDPARAKALLAEAGFPDGFMMTLSTANDRTPYGPEIAQAVAQMWTRIGVTTTVDAMPFSVYSPRGKNQQFSAYLGSLSNASMEAGWLLKTLLMTEDSAAGNGTYNWSHYSNPTLDALANRALSTVDPAAREQLLIQGIHVATDDVAFMPLYLFLNIWATRKGVTYDARVDELTLATDAHLVGGK